MSLPIIQKKFHKGEITPLLHGDTAQPWYSGALRTCKNWLPITQGALLRRPGTVYKASTRNNAVVKTKGYLFPDGRSYVLEFSDSILRFYKNGVVVGAPYELATPWTAAMLPYLKLAQVGNVITITYGGQAGGSVSPRDLTHTSGADSPWTLTVTPITTRYVQTAEWTVAPTIATAAWNNAVNYNAGDRAFQGNYSWTSLQSNNVNNAPPAAPPGNLFWTPTIDTSHPGEGANSTFYQFTATIQDNTTGQVFETGVSINAYSLGPGGVGCDAPPMADRPLTVNRPTFVPPAGFTLLFYSVYKGTFSTVLVGWLFDLSPGLTNFTDNGKTPDYTKQPPAYSAVDSNPFTPAAFTSWPGVVTHFEQRRFFGRSGVLPMSLWGSAIGKIFRWDRPTPGSDNDSVFFTIASEVLEEVRSFAPMRVCLVMTGQGEWTLRGSQGAAVTRSNVDMKRQSQWGSSWRDPIIVGNGIIFNTAKSNMVRDLYPLYGLYTDVWNGDDISWFARHFFEGHTIVDWAYQSTPHSTIWVVREDGILLSLTYDRNREVIAWAQHSLGDANAAVENVTVVQEPPEDAVYLVVRRVINGATVRYHERLSNIIQPTDQRLVVCLDACSIFDGRNVGATTMRLSGGTYLTGTQAVCTASTPQFAAADAGASSVVFDPDGAKVTARIIGFTSTTVVTVEFDADLTAAQIVAWVNAATTSWALAKSVYVVTQLNTYVVDQGIVPSAQDAPGPQPGTRGVAVLADGGAFDASDGVTVVGTTVTLPAPAVIAVIGISYNSDVQLLDAYHPSAEIRNRFKTVTKIGFHVASARGLWVGKDLNNLYEWQQRQVSDSYGAIQPGTGYFEEVVSDDWNKDGSAAVRQWEPLSCTILGVLREMEIGGT